MEYICPKCGGKDKGNHNNKSLTRYMGLETLPPFPPYEAPLYTQYDFVNDTVIRGLENRRR